MVALSVYCDVRTQFLNVWHKKFVLKRVSVAYINFKFLEPNTPHVYPK
jgi:hypothetical protein